MGQPTSPAEGATPPAEPNTPTEPAAPAKGDALGEAGLKALAEERAARKELEKQLKELQQRDPVKAIAEALGMKSTDAKPDDLAATVKQLQQEMQAERLKAARLEVAAAHGLTPAQAARLQGSTREELEADAVQLKELFPAAAESGKPSAPRPDPTQGARGSGAPGELTRSDVERLFREGKYAEIEKARAEGRIKFEKKPSS